MSKPAHLYVIANGAGAHKVGMSARPRTRLRQLQTASARRLALIRTTAEPVENAGAVEAYAHWLLREAQEEGEWFTVTAEAAWVAIVAATEAVARGERAPQRIAGPGRPDLGYKLFTIRLTAGTRERIIALVGERNMAAFIREAIEEKLERHESIAHKPKTKPKPPPPSPAQGEG